MTENQKRILETLMGSGFYLNHEMDSMGLIRVTMKRYAPLNHNPYGLDSWSSGSSGGYLIPKFGRRYNVVNQLEVMAYGHATAQLISCDNGFEGTWYERYQYLAECVSEDKEPEGWVAWQPFETWEWRDIVEQIDNEATSLLTTLRQALKLAKKGLVQAALNMSSIFCDDMNQLDMEHMVEVGANQ